MSEEKRPSTAPNRHLIDGVPAGFRDDSVRFPRLRSAVKQEHFDLHVAALEWSLDAPITIRGEADIQSRRSWNDRLQPYAHQIQNLITFCRRAPVALLADDVGLGKTISAGLILSELMARRKVSRALVVAPKLLLPQWHEELATKFGIPAEAATGAELAGAIARRVPVVVSTYQSLRSYLPELRRANFDMIILDEAHKLRNLHGTSQPPQFAVGVRQALADRVFKYVLMLTATPIQNRLWDLYSLVDLLTAAKGHGNPLGTATSFKARYIDDSRAVRIRYGVREEFRRHLSNYIVRTRRSDARLVFPTRRVRMYRVEPTPHEYQLLELIGDLLKHHRLNGLAQSSIGQAVMSSPHALARQLEEMAQRGTVPGQIARQAAAAVVSGGVAAKLTGLSQLISELSSRRPDDWRVVVFTSRTATQEAIGGHLKRLGVPVGFIRGSQHAGNERAIRAFREQPPGVRVLVSTDAGAEGVNLQVANVLVNYDLPWNPMALEQRIGRVQRLASRHAEVTVLNLVLAGSVEEKVVGRLSEKLQAVSESLGDIEGILESVGGASDEEESFEAMIRNLVVDSLRGIDVNEATRRAMESIEAAKRIYEEERQVVDQTLGDLRDLHRTGPRVPEISPVTPSVDAQDFVLRALANDGARLRQVDGGMWSVTLPGRNEFHITFDDRERVTEEDAVFGGNPAKPFVPGKRDFERLAQSWSDKAGAFIVDRTQPADRDIERALTDWLAGRSGVTLVDHQIIDRCEGFAGELTFRASVAVDHDRLEKLVTLPVRSGPLTDVERPTSSEAATSREFETGSLAARIEDQVKHAVEAEADLGKFCSFYRDRLKEELVAAMDPARQRRILEQFTPAMAAEAVAARGVRYAVLTAVAQVRVDGEGPYEARFALLPAAGSPVAAPASEWTVCEQTERWVPASAVDVCSITGQRVLVHLMVKSEASGRMGLRERMVRCEATKAILLPSEVDHCCATGQLVAAGLLQASAMSGRKALPEQLVECQCTGVMVLHDEIATSAVSGKRFRVDQATASSLSGRVGHSSEFVHAAMPDGLLATDEAECSEVSGTWVQVGRLVPSECPPHRRALPEEMVASAVSGKLVLPGEVEYSRVSGQPAMPDEMVMCDFSGVPVLPTEIAISQVSGKRYRADRGASSAKSGRTGHRDEFVEVVLPQGIIASDEVGSSDVSGTLADRDVLVASQLPPHRRGLPSEVVASDVSGLRVLSDEVERSALGGGIALPDELASCEVTGARVLPVQLLRSDVSGRLFRVDQSLQSATSGRRGHASEFVRSVAPTGWIARDEGAQSSLSGEWGAAAMLMPSSRPPHRLGLAHEVVVCEWTGLRLLRDEVAASAVSGKVVDDALLVASAASGGRAVAEEMVTCEVTGRRLLPSEASACSITGKRVDVRELVRSDMSGAAGLASLMVCCAATGNIALPIETTRCEASGVTVLLSETERCSITGRIADRRLLRRCPTSGEPYVDDDPARQQVQRLAGTSIILARCPWSDRLLLAHRLRRCAISGLRVEPSQLNAQGELTNLRKLLNGEGVVGAQPLVHAELLRIQAAHLELGSAKEAVACRSANGQIAIAVVKVKTGMLGLSTSFWAIAFQLEGPTVLLCDPVPGKRDGSIWRPRTAPADS